MELARLARARKRTNSVRMGNLEVKGIINLNVHQPQILELIQIEELDGEAFAAGGAAALED